MYKRAKFNRVQQAMETLDTFIIGLYALAENSNYSAFHDKFIRHHTVVGLK